MLSKVVFHMGRTSRTRQMTKRLIPPVIARYRGKRTSGKIALTFDDGPLTPLTESVLALLRRRRATATFFVVGERAEAEPNIVRSMVDQGCEVGNHSYSHPFLHRMSAADMELEIGRTNKIIEEITGSAPKYFRPPYGGLSVRLWWHLRRAHSQPPLLWSAATRGYEYDRTERQIVQDLVDAQLSAGDILLLHDAHPPTVSALPAILDLCHGRNLAPVTVSSLLASTA